jgi:ubiquinone/menaquinone biosynthesis C-methylase UbiE
LVSPETERVRRFYDGSAADYDRWMRTFDRLLIGDGRQRICGRASGRTLELAIGTGLNLTWYPPNIALTGIDLSPAMLAAAERRAGELGRPVELQLADAQALEFPDGRFDTVVATFAVCTIPDERRALTEAHRVLRPGGQLLLLEHVRSPVTPVRWVQRLLDPLMSRVEADHLLRDPLDHLAEIGFAIELSERSRWGIIELLVARKV